MRKNKKEPIVTISSDDVMPISQELIVWAHERKITPATFAASMLLVLDVLKEQYGFELQDISSKGRKH